MSTGSKEHIAKETVTLSRGEAAARLRSLADEVEAGWMAGGSRPLRLPESVTFELDIACKEKHGEQRYEIEAEIHWAEPSAS